MIAGLAGLKRLSHQHSRPSAAFADCGGPRTALVRRCAPGWYAVRTFGPQDSEASVHFISGGDMRSSRRVVAKIRNPKLGGGSWPSAAILELRHASTGAWFIASDLSIESLAAGADLFDAALHFIEEPDPERFEIVHQLVE